MRLKRMTSLVALTLFLTPLAPAYQDQPGPEAQGREASPPTVDQILENYINALGGKAAIQKVSSRISKGTVKVPGVALSGTVEIYEKAPNKQLVIVQVPGLGAMRRGFNGTVGWIEEPLSDEPRDLKGGELVSARRDADFYQAIRLRELYPRMMFKGREVFGGGETYVLEAPRGGNPRRWYFDIVTGLLIGTTSSEGGELNEEGYADYRAVDGIKLPFTMRRADLDDAVITISEVKHNIPIDDQRFEKPVKSANSTPLPVTGAARAKSGQVIPFELYNNNIYLQVRVNGSRPLRFVLDSGASNSVIDETRARTLGLKVSEMNEASAGSGEGKTRIGSAEGVTFGLPGTELFLKHIMVLPVYDLFKLDGQAVDGILGYDLFTRYVVEIDYSAKRLTIHDPQTYHYSGAGDVIPFKLISNRPAVQARVIASSSTPIEGEFVVDTGMNGAFGLYSPVVSKHNLLASGQKTIPTTGVGIGGEVKLSVGRVKSFQLGRFLIQSPVCLFSQASSGTSAGNEAVGQLGGELLRRFKVIFDYSRRHIVLEPGEHLQDPYEADMSGAFLIAEGEDLRTIKVYRVLANSPAAEAGIVEGDIVISVDGKPVNDFSLDQIGQLFKQEGSQLLFTIKRGEKLLQLKIKMRRLI